MLGDISAAAVLETLSLGAALIMGSDVGWNGCITWMPGALTLHL